MEVKLELNSTLDFRDHSLHFPGLRWLCYPLLDSSLPQTLLTSPEEDESTQRRARHRNSQPICGFSASSFIFTESCCIFSKCKSLPTTDEAPAPSAGVPAFASGASQSGNNWHLTAPAGSGGERAPSRPGSPDQPPPLCLLDLHTIWPLQLPGGSFLIHLVTAVIFPNWATCSLPVCTDSSVLLGAGESKSVRPSVPVT